MRVRNVASYGFLGLGAFSLMALPLVLWLVPPMAAVCLALCLMFVGCAWLVMAPETAVGAGRPMQLFLGRLLLAFGAPIAILGGVFAIFLWVMFIPPVLTHTVPHPRLLQPQSLLSAIVGPLVIGGAPCLVGWTIAAFGRRLIRSYKRKAGG